MKNGFTMLKSDSGKWAAIIALILMGILLSSNTFAKELKKLHEKDFAVKSGEKLKISAEVADLNIRTWDKEEINIKVYGNNKAESRMQFEFEKTSYGVRIRAEKSGSWISNLFGTGIQAKIDIMAPKNFELELSTSGGDITVGSLKGKQYIHTSGGDIELSNTEGNLNAITSGGDIKVHKHFGWSKVETSGGDIIFKDCEGDVNGETSGGDITVEARNGKINLSTSGGDIKLYYKGDNRGIMLDTSGGDIYAFVPGDIKANADFSTSGGDVTNKIKATNAAKESSHKFIGELNGGGNKFTAETSGGDIVVKEK